jgi:hypothetical protein
MGLQLPSVRGTNAVLSAKRVQARERLERDALAGVVAHPSLTAVLAELPASHLHDDTSRAVRAHLVDGTPVIGDALVLLAELDARAETEGIDEGTAKQLLLRLKERAIKAELTTQPERAKELNTQLTQIREAMRSLDRAAVPD